MSEPEGPMAERKGESLSETESPPIQRSLPWLIISLVIISWTVFVYSLYKNNCPSKTPPEECLLHGALGRFSFQPLEENPQFGPSVSTLLNLGVLRWNFKEKGTNKWHILSSIFFHRGLVSLILDTISLLFMGTELEQNFGIAKTGLLYLLSSLGGSLWVVLTIKYSLYVGGPSGVCGLTGGAFAELFINWNMHDQKLKRVRSLSVGAAINFAIKLFPRADVSANIGGLYWGFLLGFLLLIRRQPENGGHEYKRSGFDLQKLIMNYSWHQWVLWLFALMSIIIQLLYSLIKYILH